MELMLISFRYYVKHFHETSSPEALVAAARGKKSAEREAMKRLMENVERWFKINVLHFVSNRFREGAIM